jgi:hypothetical protein
MRMNGNACGVKLTERVEEEAESVPHVDAAKDGAELRALRRVPEGKAVAAHFGPAGDAEANRRRPRRHLAGYGVPEVPDLVGPVGGELHKVLLNVTIAALVPKVDALLRVELAAEAVQRRLCSLLCVVK